MMVAATLQDARCTNSTASFVVMCSMTIFRLGNFATSGCLIGRINKGVCNHHQRRRIPTTVIAYLEHLLDEHALPIEDVDMLVRHLSVSQQRHANLGHSLLHNQESAAGRALLCSPRGSSPATPA